MLKTNFLVQVNYKSGSKERVWVDEFNAKTTNGNITEAGWDCSDCDTNRPISMGINNIESVWQKGVRYTFLGITVYKSVTK